MNDSVLIKVATERLCVYGALFSAVLSLPPGTAAGMPNSGLFSWREAELVRASNMFQHEAASSHLIQEIPFSRT